MSENWTRVVNTTIADYIRQEEVNVLRERKLLALLQSRGRLTFNHEGDEMNWKVRYKRAPMTGYADGDTLSFARKERHKTAVLGWRGYSATDSVSKMEKLQNKGAAAIIKIFDNTARLLMEDISENFAGEFYIDGNAAGNLKRLHGIESFFGVSGTAAAGVDAPSDTYAGLNTGLGYYGGSWSALAAAPTTDWPSGSGDASYDFWSPLVIDYAHTGWAGATNTWKDNCSAVLRYAITHQGRNASKKKMMDLVLLDPDLFRQFANAQDGKQQITIRRGDKVGLVSLGFTDVIEFDGMEVTREYGVPRLSGYGLAIDQMELCSLQDRLFVPEGPDFEIASKSHRFSIDFMGNLKCNPRYFTKFKKTS